MIRHAISALLRQVSQRRPAVHS